MAEESYRDFAAKLIPGGMPMLGVRLPALRALAKQMAHSGVWQLPAPGTAAYMEEVMLRGMLIGYAPRGVGIEERLTALERFVPFITNWSICDSCCTTYTFARRHRERVWQWLAPYLASAEEYPARFAVVLLLTQFKQDAAWAARIAATLPTIPATAYYAEMAIAWCACELILLYPALADSLLSSLRPTIHRLTLRKLRESRRSVAE